MSWYFPIEFDGCYYIIISTYLNFNLIPPKGPKIGLNIDLFHDWGIGLQ